METKFGRWLKSRSFKAFFFIILVDSIAYSGLRIGNALEWGSWTMALPSCFYSVFPFVSFAIFFICRNRKCFDAWAEPDCFLFFMFFGLQHHWLAAS